MEDLGTRVLDLAGLDALVALLRSDGYRVHATDGEPTRLLEAWTGAALAILVDAVLAPDTPGRVAEPGRVYRTDLAAATPAAGPAAGAASSHGLGVPAAYALGRALDRLPGRLVVYAVEAADVRPGLGLTPSVAAAVPAVTAAILSECRQALAEPEARR